MQFLRSAGFNPLTMTPINGSGIASQSSYLGEAIKAMGDDITRKMAAVNEIPGVATLIYCLPHGELFSWHINTGSCCGCCYYQRYPKCSRLEQWSRVSEISHYSSLTKMTHYRLSAHYPLPSIFASKYTSFRSIFAIRSSWSLQAVKLTSYLTRGLWIY